MADNYLEKRWEEIHNRHGSSIIRNSLPLDTLIARNRSHRGFDNSYQVHMRQLEAIVSVNTKLSSGRNAQTLRFKLVDNATPGCETLSSIRIGGALSELRLPLPGQEAKAFIVVCSTVGESPIVDIDLGISLEAMGLKAVELGLNSLIIKAFDKETVKRALNLELEPLIVLAVGKGLDKIALVEVHEGDSLKYYRKDGIHYVPKLSIRDILL